MEIGTVSRLSSSAGTQPAVRQDAPSQAGSVKSDLPATQAVQQAAALSAQPVTYNLRDDARATATRIAALQSVIENRNVYDVGSRQIVFRAVNTTTGEVVRQFPDDVALKLRAFVRDISEQKQSSDAAEADVQHVTRIA
jgi:uncharacterized FlaG/YvyC family protein